MKEILSVILLLAVAVILYVAIIDGDSGMEGKVKNGGGRVHNAIEQLNP